MNQLNNIINSTGGGGGYTNIFNSNVLNNLNFLNGTTKYGILKLYVNAQNPELVDLYKAQVQLHNNSILNDRFPNSGFDLFVPDQQTFNRGSQNKMINHQVKCEMYFVDYINQVIEPSAYMLYPRSSLSKTELMLSNHTGIIDSGYRGFLMGAFRWLKLENSDLNQYVVDRYTRLLQLCLPTLHPIFVVVIDESELSDTIRGSGGFGSTGL